MGSGCRWKKDRKSGVEIALAGVSEILPTADL